MPIEGAGKNVPWFGRPTVIDPGFHNGSSPSAVPSSMGVVLPEEPSYVSPVPGVSVQRDVLGQALAGLIIVGVFVGVAALAWSVARAMRDESPGGEDPENPPPSAGEGT